MQPTPLRMAQSCHPELPRLALLTAAVILLGSAGGCAARARNVILFLGDAGGIPTLNAAGILAHDRPQSLFIQGMPHIALSDTSALDSWVTDSAAGMTAIVTGRKTNDGMLSMLPGRDGQPGPVLKTLLEYAEERGLSTGVVTNMSVWDATPAACYAHVASRRSMVEIFQQLLAPRYGDGVDVIVGKDRRRLFPALAAAGIDPDAALRKAGYAVFDAPAAIPGTARRAACIYDGADFEPQPVIDAILQILGRNRKGYFLMVEWDMHTPDMRRGLDRVIVMDNLIRHVAGRVGRDTLLVFAADHSYDLRLQRGDRSKPLASQLEPPEGAAAVSPAATPAAPVPAGSPAAPAIKPPKLPLRVNDTHTGEEILVAAQGPGAERLRGFIPNTRIFEVMMQAFGWREAR